MKAALLMVDMSVEQVASLSKSQRLRVVNAIQSLAKLKSFALKVDSRLWLHDDQESTLSQVYPEWGVTMGVPGSPGADLLPELKTATENWQFVEKKHFSSFVDSKLSSLLQQHAITHVYIVGINTDFCIFNTAMDAFARGRLQVKVVQEGVGSICGQSGHEQGLAWIRAHLGPQAVVSVKDVIRQFS